MPEMNCIKKRLSDFPTEIIEKILSFLPTSTIQESLLVVDDLRPYIIDKYFTQEIRLHLDPPVCLRWFGITPIEDMFEVNEIGGIERIGRFLTNNPGIIPHKYVVFPDAENSLLFEFLQVFRAALIRAPQLEIKLKSSNTESYEPPASVPDELMDLIYSFPNIYSVEVWSTESFFPGTVHPPSSMKKLKLDGLEILDWSSVSLSHNLTHLNISITYSYDGMGSGGNVTNEVLSQLLGTKLPTKSPMRLESLVSLSISNCSLHGLDLSIFPPTLEQLKYSCNGYLTIDESPANLSWPKGLKHLSLTHNNINDVTLKRLDKLRWPCHLEELDLGGNSFAHLENITRLPQTLKTLRLGDNRFATLDGLKGLPSSLEVLDLMNSHWLENFNVTRGPEEYPYFKFPESLRRLSLNFCQIVSWGVDGYEDSVPISQRLHFPKSLQYLNLSGSNLTSLACFVFPESLQTLEMDSNDIQDLTSYNSRPGSEGRVNWDQLAGLRELRLESNDLTTLKGWVPPRSLRKLRLSNRGVSHFETKAIPLFNRRFHESTNNLRELFIQDITIDFSDPDFYLPQNLTSFGLSSSRNFRLDLLPSLSKHENLVELGLAHNEIRDVKASQLPPNLKHLMLASNKISTLGSHNSFASLEHLEVLNLEDNKIQIIDPSWKLPRKLRNLDLSYNSISTCEFMHSVASHEHLNYLGLSDNPIQNISLGYPERKPSSPLKILNVSYLPLGNSGSISDAGFCRLLESMGIKAIDRNRPISREHIFV